VPNEEDLADAIRQLRKGSLASCITERVSQFQRLGRLGSDEEVFSELCYCILTANSKAAIALRIQECLGVNSFLAMRGQDLAKMFRQLGQRFYNLKSKYIVRAREFHNIRSLLLEFPNPHEKRAWLAANVLGIGYKEASHFLRNIGELDLAILDIHVIRVLTNHNIFKNIRRPISKETYLACERALRSFSKNINMSIGELDLYIWYMDTGEILK
jgi:N-glycosylase/DNA lyase